MNDNDFNLSEGYTPDDFESKSTYSGPAEDLSMSRTRRPFRSRDYEGETVLVPEQEPQIQSQPKQETKPQNTAEKVRRVAAEKDDDASISEKKAEKPKKERKPKKPRDPNAPNPIIKFFTDERTRVFIAIMLILCSILVVIAVFSHFRHGATDQSAVLNLPLTEIANNQLTENTAGGFGAKLSYILLCDALGLGSLVLIVYMWILALGLLGLRKCNFWGTTFRALLVAITISIVLGLITYDNDSTVYWGGNHGHYINKLLLDHTSWVGALMLSILLVAAVCCVYLNELRKFWAKWREAARKRAEQIRAERTRIVEAARRTARKEAQKEDFDLDDESTAQPADDDNDNQQHEQIKPITSPLTDALKSLKDKIMQDKPAVEPERSEAKAEAEADPSETVVFDPEILQQFATDTAPAETKSQIEVQGNGCDFVAYVNEIDMADPSEIEANEQNKPFDPRAELSRYVFPSVELLEDRPSGPAIDMAEQQANKERIEKTLLDYKIPIQRIEATVGPTVTLYEIVPAEGVRISQIKRLEDDIALSLAALGIRIIAPIPGKGTVGIEVPNNDPRTVSMRSVISSRKFQECKMALPMAMGATISNDIFIADLAKMPHLLVAGATGMGKSVGLNAIIASLLYKKHPTELKLVLVDPKMVEFSLYSKLERHYLAKLQNNDDAIITDMKDVVTTLNSLCVEMDNRYDLLRNANVRSLEEYNKKFTERRLNPNDGHKYLPYIVVVVDEFADLIMTQGREVETPIARIAQKARAVGIHMILATQRPSTNVITGLIKANFPGRIAFRVIQMVDSRTILDCPGANQLIGRGDMLFSHNGSMERVQCAFISTEEVEALTEAIDRQVGFEHAYYLPEYVPEEAEGGVIAGASTDRDTLFNEAARFVVSKQMGSTSSLQRQFGIGYNRAGKLMDQLEAAGIVGGVNGSKPRNILVDMITLDAMLGD